MSDSAKEINNTLNEAIVPSFSNDTESNQEQNVKKRKIGLPLIILAVCLFLVLIIGGFSAFLFKRSADVEKVKQARNDAYQKFKQGNYIAAKEAAKKGLSISGDPYLLKTYIDASSAQGNLTGKEVDVFKKTQPLLSKLEEVDGKNAESLMSIGYAYEIAGKYEQALSYYERALVVDPKSGIAYFHKGHVLAFINRNDESKIAYEKAYELDPENPLIAMAKTTMLYQEKDSESALELLVKIGDNKNFNKDYRAEAYTAAALIEMGRNNNSDAKQYAKRAVDTGSTFSTGNALYGFYLAQNPGTYAEGIKYLTTALKQNPRISNNYLLLGIVMRSNNYLKEAVAFQKAGLASLEKDNTLLGEKARGAMEAKMDYELAQTYSLNKDIDNTLLYLKLAVSKNILYKTEIQTDIKVGYYANVSNNPAFANYINSK